MYAGEDYDLAGFAVGAAVLAREGETVTRLGELTPAGGARVVYAGHLA
jgi:hypothetical protein